MSISISVTGIDEVIAKIEKLKNLRRPILDGMNIVMEEAMNIATIAYASQGIENLDFTPSLEELQNGYVLRMSGEDVGFLEFGAGWQTESNEMASQVSYPVAMGSYSELHQGQFFKTGYRFWYYAGTRYTGIMPTRGMQRALDYVRDNLSDMITRAIAAWIEN